jgi:hypothetical protein
MSTSVEMVQPAELAELAETIQREHAAVGAAAMMMLYHGIACGEALIKAKACVGRGHWMVWMNANLPFGQTTASSYMAVARHRDALLAAEDVTTMQTAIRYLKEHRLTTQTRIDQARIVEIRERAAAEGISRAARMLGESYGTVRRYAQGAEKVKRTRTPGSGVRIAFTDQRIGKLASWMAHHLFQDVAVDDRIRDLALQALQATFGGES